MRANAGPSAPPPKRARGRPRCFDTEATLDRALELFWKGGYRTTTTRDLEASLGLNQSSLYHQFGSKAALLEAVLDRYETKTNDAVLASLDSSAAGLAAIGQFFTDLAHWVTHDGRRGCMLINMMAEDGAATEAIRQRTRRYRKRVKLALRNALRRAVEHGEVPADDVDQRANLLMGMVLGFNIAARGGATATELTGLLGSVRSQVNAWRAA